MERPELTAVDCNYCKVRGYSPCDKVQLALEYTEEWDYIDWDGRMSKALAEFIIKAVEAYEWEA